MMGKIRRPATAAGSVTAPALVCSIGNGLPRPGERGHHGGDSQHIDSEHSGMLHFVCRGADPKSLMCLSLHARLRAAGRRHPELDEFACRGNNSRGQRTFDREFGLPVPTRVR